MCGAGSDPRIGAPAVRPAASGDTGALSGVLARAFQGDPVTGWIVPDPARRARVLPRVYGLMLRTWFIDHACVDVLTEGTVIRAGALWNPPGRTGPTAAVGLRQLPTVLRLAGVRAPRLFTVEAALRRARPRAPHWHLAELATDPSRQGAGLGARLLRHGLARADADHAPSYLEAPAANVAFYERFGFAATATIDVRRGPRIHGMWREPR